jgi:hypothetical protein
MYRSRRAALRGVAALGGLSMFAPAIFSRLLQGDPDDRIAEELLERVGTQLPASPPMGAIVLAVARQFLGAPYRAGTLEGTGPERLVLNLREFDCVTLVESTLAIARCIAADHHSARNVRDELTLLRYRDGIAGGYAGRLHYFTDWIADNERKGVLRDVTLALGGISRRTTINFMSTHPGAYPRLRDPAVLAAIRERERALSAPRRATIPLRLLSGAASGIVDGDIIGISASVPGLDIIHTGLAAHVNRQLHFLHAPLSGGTVIVSREPLGEMIRAHHPHSGVVVARPLRP